MFVLLIVLRALLACMHKCSDNPQLLSADYDECSVVSIMTLWFPLALTATVGLAQNLDSTLAEL